MSKKKPDWQTPGVIFQPHVSAGVQAGINHLVDAISPTLGPYPRVVLYDTSIGTGGRLPQVLDDGGTIARRIIGLRNRDADVGAMLVRHMLWRQHEDVGDGTATTAVLFQAIYNEGVRYIAAGGNPMRLRVYLEQGLRVILSELAAMTTQLQGKDSLTRLAEIICYDAPMAKLLGEVFDIIGEYGRLEIRSSKSRETEREYVEGMYWDGGVLSRAMIANTPGMRAELENPALLLTNLDIEDPRDLLPALAIVVRMEIPGLVIVARKLSDVVQGFIAMNQQQQRIKAQIIAVQTPGVGLEAQHNTLADLAVLTGGHPFTQMAGEKLSAIKPEDLGRARRVWATKEHVGIIGGRGDPRALRQHIAGLRRAFNQVSKTEDRAALQQRIGKLLGGSATLWVAGMTETELEFNKGLAERTAEALRGAIREGVVPGGGVALLNCRAALRVRLAQAEEPEERAAYHILIEALAAPIRTLLHNAGLEPGAIFADIETAGPGYGFDVRTSEIVDVAGAGIYDAASVLRAVANNAIRTAALALTTDVVVHRRNPPESTLTD